MRINPCVHNALALNLLQRVEVAWSARGHFAIAPMIVLVADVALHGHARPPTRAMTLASTTKRTSLLPLDWRFVSRNRNAMNNRGFPEGADDGRV